MSYGKSIGTAINVPRSIKRAVQMPEVKMKRTFKQRLKDWLFKEEETEKNYVTLERDTISSNGMRFNLYVAKGGYVVEIRKYNESTDRNHNQLYVFADEANLGEELAKIITMEAMR